MAQLTHASKTMSRLFIRLFLDDRSFIGPGKIELLERINTNGSIRRAARAMKMSYRRAWMLLKATEEIFGRPLVETATGGSKGGGSVLTAFGEEIVARFRSVERKARKGAASEIAALERLAGKSQKRRRRRPK